MGNVDTRCKYDHGYLMVQTASPYYRPGDTVTGSIYLRAMHPLDVTNVVIEVKGAEKVCFVQSV